MANPNTTIQVTADADELFRILNQLQADLSNLVYAPLDVRQLARSAFNNWSELVCIESRVTSGASVAVLFKPSQRLLDLCAAVRTGDFDGFVVEKAHGDAPD